MGQIGTATPLAPADDQAEQSQPCDARPHIGFCLMPYAAVSVAQQLAAAAALYVLREALAAEDPQMRAAWPAPRVRFFRCAGAGEAADFEDVATLWGQAPLTRAGAHEILIRAELGASETALTALHECVHRIQACAGVGETLPEEELETEARERAAALLPHCIPLLRELCDPAADVSVLAWLAMGKEEREAAASASHEQAGRASASVATPARSSDAPA